MTTNNPPIAAWAPGTALAKLASRHNNAPCVLTDGPAEFNDVALIRLSDYERLQVELELWKAKIDAMAEHEVAARQLTGIPASVGISEPVEGFAKRPQDIMPAVRDMALRIELLESQLAESEALLAESRANDQQAMRYLNQVREIVGGDDFPDMVRRCERLQAKCARLQAAMIEAKGHISHYMYGGSSYREPAAEAIAIIDAAMEGDKP